MDNLDLLSDDELRHRLIQYGFQNLPITSNTRKLLIKKLRNHMENEKGKLRRETSFATRYSSGEESDSGDKRSAKGGRRSTTAAAGATRSTMPPPAARPASRRTTATTTSINTGISTTSSPLKNNNNNNNSSNASHNKSISPGSNRSSVYISPVIINDSEEEDYSGGLRTSRVFGKFLKNCLKFP